VDVVFDTEKMHVFDKQTEMALASTRSQESVGGRRREVPPLLR
jgi:hypothetical protein